MKRNRLLGPARGSAHPLRLQLTALMMVAVAVAGAGLPATADTARHRDPNDTSGRLDVAVVRHGHSSDDSALKHLVRTREGWSKRAFRRRGTLRLVFSLRGDSCAEAEVVVDVARGRWRGRWRGYDPLGCGRGDDSGGYGEFLRRVPVRKSARDRIVVEVPRDLFPQRASEYRWGVTTTWTCDQPCGDNAPDRANGDRAPIQHTL